MIRPILLLLLASSLQAFTPHIRSTTLHIHPSKTDHSSIKTFLAVTPPPDDEPEPTNIEPPPPPPTTTTTTTSSSSSSTTSLPEAILSRLINLPSTLLENSSSIQNNLLSSGQFGQKGEIYVAIQLSLLLCIIIGGIPLIGDVLIPAMGLIMFLIGSVSILLAVEEMGGALSPWPVVSDGLDGLITGGDDESFRLFGQMRHPMYASLLVACAGLSVITGSSSRLLLTVILGFVLDVKADYEEGELVKKFPEEYGAYREKVPSKFVPIALLEVLPWTKNN